MGLLCMHITGQVATKAQAEKIAEKLRSHFPQEEFDIQANYREDLNTDKVTVEE